MTPAHCRVKHDPERGQYGDCVRACIASLLNISNADEVPHFYHDNCEGDEGLRRIRKYLANVGYVPFAVAFDGSVSYSEILEIMGRNNPDVYYMLFGSIGEGDHVVICQGGRKVHDPAWYPMPFVGPSSAGVWSVMVLVKS